MIYGIGIDIVDVPRFKAAMDRRGERFLRRLFTEAELSYCLGRKNPEAHLAARFAGKMSLFKALGRSFSFRDVEIVRDSRGAPHLKSTLLLPYKCSISITHDGNLSIAETIVETSP